MKMRSVFLAGSLILIGVINLALAPLIAAQGVSPPEGEGQFIQVVVQPGDSLAKYAVLYGVSGSAMLAVNNLPDPDLIFPGQTIVIPVIKTRTPSLTTPFYYIVQQGDTLTSIGKRFHIDGGTIGFANGSFIEFLIPGQVYLIPAGPHYEIVIKGEHLGIIAARYGVTINFLLKANPGVADPSLLVAGQRINVPIIYDTQTPIPIPPSPITATPLPTMTGAVVIIIPDTETPTPTGTTTPVVFPTRTPKPTATNIAEANNFMTLIVQPGESLVNYVFRYGVSGSAILAVNPQLQVNPDLIFPGDIITIPVVNSFTPSRSTPFFYVVRSGDTVTSIARMFEMDIDTLIEANPTGSFGAGTTVLIPAGPHEYFLKVGETLATVAAKYLTPLKFLLKANPAFASADTGFVGQRVFIPLRIDAEPVAFN